MLWKLVNCKFFHVNLSDFSVFLPLYSLIFCSFQNRQRKNLKYHYIALHTYTGFCQSVIHIPHQQQATQPQKEFLPFCGSLKRRDFGFQSQSMRYRVKLKSVLRKSKDLNELSDTTDLIFLNDNITILSLLLLLFVSLTFLWHVSLIYSINVNIKKIKFTRISQKRSLL